MGLFSKLFSTKQSAKNQQLNGNPCIEISVETSSHYTQTKQKTKGLLPAIPLDAFDGYVSPSGGFVNYARFQVIGIKPETKRKNKRVYEVRNKEDACKCAESDGLTGPFDVTVLPSTPPSDRQLSYAKSLGANIPDGACAFDVSAIISRINDNDESPVSEKLARQAHKFGVNFSRYHGRVAIMSIANANLPVMEYSNFISSLLDNHISNQ